MDEEGFMMEIERFTKQENPRAGRSTALAPTKAKGRAHRHGPPDHLGRRGGKPHPEPRSDAGRRQGRHASTPR
jgi:hypothetical protein